MLQVFVYGTLKPQGKYYPIYCKGKTLSEISCWTRGKLFDLPVGYPAMIHGEDRVSGYLYSFASEQELVYLDSLEGYTGRVDSPLNEYYRQQITVYDHNDSPLAEAWAYLMSAKQVNKLGGVYLPSGNWEINSK